MTDKTPDACPEAGGGDMAKTATPSSQSNATMATLAIVTCGADYKTASRIMVAIIACDVPGVTFSEETK